MNDKRWLEEKDPLRLMMKLQEEIGEVQHAFNRRNHHQVLNEIEDVVLILACLKDRVLEVGIPDSFQPERYRND